MVDGPRQVWWHWGDVETLAFCDDKSVHGCEAKSMMISVHGSERLCDEVRMKE